MYLCYFQESAPESSPVSNVDIEVDDEIENENVIVDYSSGAIVEEIVVTVDDTGISEEQPETEVDSSPLLAPAATVSVPGGVLTSETPESGISEKFTYIFKDPNFIHSSKGPGGNKKTRIWKNLKQIVAAERSLAWKPEDVTCELEYYIRPFK
ncbi:INO80 complex subunit C-like [Elysia marginata]|uniref:INO80 complex subunit C-like n=1 Tax=Elysia marginata TaxID=1093978 RepID=A0AAV4FZ34_9GAST|nr:INO80 complex subunit C-like [Elysia marginata]